MARKTNKTVVKTRRLVNCGLLSGQQMWIMIRVADETVIEHHPWFHGRYVGMTATEGETAAKAEVTRRREERQSEWNNG